MENTAINKQRGQKEQEHVKDLAKLRENKEDDEGEYEEEEEQPTPHERRRQDQW